MNERRILHKMKIVLCLILHLISKAKKQLTPSHPKTQPTLFNYIDIVSFPPSGEGAIQRDQLEFPIFIMFYIHRTFSAKAFLQGNSSSAMSLPTL